MPIRIRNYAAKSIHSIIRLFLERIFLFMIPFASRRFRTAWLKGDGTSRFWRSERLKRGGVEPKMVSPGWHTVPAAGRVPLVKYARIAIIVHSPIPASEECYERQKRRVRYSAA
jgi:hypothetical protein